MSIKELVKAFAKGERYGAASSRRVRIEGDLLINFDTIIAERTENGVKLNTRYYSQTTSKLQNLIKYYCNVTEEYENNNNFYKYQGGEW